jgi:hypothetical protein
VYDQKKWHVQGHCGLMSIYVILLISFTAARVAHFFVRPPVEVFRVEHANMIQGLPLKVSVTCNLPDACGTITLAPSYDAATTARDPLCASTSTSYANEGSSNMVLCYTDANVTPGIVVTSFPRKQDTATSTDPGVLTVRVEALSAAGTKLQLDHSVGMETWQRKTFVVGQAVERDVDGDESKQPYFNNVQYDGQNTGSAKSELSFRVHQNVNVYDQVRHSFVFLCFAFVRLCALRFAVFLNSLRLSPHVLMKMQTVVYRSRPKRGSSCCHRWVEEPQSFSLQLSCCGCWCLTRP